MIAVPGRLGGKENVGCCHVSKTRWLSLIIGSFLHFWYYPKCQKLACTWKKYWRKTGEIIALKTPGGVQCVTEILQGAE